MNQDWTCHEANDAACQMIREAIALIGDAADIFHANEFDVQRMDALKALDSLREIVED